MAEVDLAAYLTRSPDERVLWQGRALVGARWPSWPRLVAAALAVWLAPVAVAAARADHVQPLALALSFLIAPGSVLVVIGGSKLVGPSYRSLALAAFAGALFAAAWTDDVRRFGVEGALERVRPGTLVAVLIFVGLPLAMIVERLTWRLGTVYVITDQKVGALYTRDGKRPWLLWVEPLWVGGALRARVERSWRCPEGWLVVGERELDLRGEEAERALAEVRAARGAEEGG